MGGFNWDDLNGVSYLPLFEQNIKNGFSNLLEEHTLVDEIRWCLDKGFYQQALALIESKIPKEFKNKQVFSYKRVEKKQKIIAATLFDNVVYYVGGEKVPILQDYFTTDTSRKRLLTEEQYNNRLINTNEVKENVSKVDNLNGYLTFRKGENTIPITDYEVSFAEKIDRQQLTAFLLIHKLIKDVRNDAMHVKNFQYDLEEVKKALKCYLALGEEILYGTAK